MCFKYVNNNLEQQAVALFDNAIQNAESVSYFFIVFLILVTAFDDILNLLSTSYESI